MANYNRNYYSTKKQPSSLFYILFSIVIIAIIIGAFFANASQQKKNLTFNESPVEQLTFEMPDQIKRWHNQDAKFVYLTFDDGPTKNAPKILDILNQYNVKGTFFVLGSSISNNANASEVLNRMVDEGHYIGMHTMSHDYKHLYGDNGPANFVDELREEQKLISEITNGFESQLCRAPYGTGGGTFTPAHITSLNQAGFKCWDWDVDSLDWKYADANKVIEDVKHDTELRKDATNLVVLFHEKNSTLEALPKVIEYYQSLGYEFLPYNPDQHFSRNFFHSDEI